MKPIICEETKKEMSEIYRIFLECEKVKKEKVQALIAEYTDKAAGLEVGQKQFKALAADFRNKILTIYEEDTKVSRCG